MRLPVEVAVALLALSFTACHGTTSFVSGEGLTTVTSADAAAAPCNDLEQKGQDVDLVGSSAAPPTPAGGVIADGVYVLTSSILHTKDNADGKKLVAMGKITISVSGSVAQLVRTTADGHERRTTVNRVTSGATTTSRTTCGPARRSADSDVTTSSYTATPRSFQFISPGPAGTVVATYTKI
jgi:hypothetical protein